jgi:anti-sigma B factor antagonist
MKHFRSDEDGEVVLHVEGALDAVSAPELRPALDAVVAERPRLVTFDLSRLELIDSSGVGAIVSVLKRVREAGGDVRVRGLRDQPLAIFQLLRLDRVFLRAS